MDPDTSKEVKSLLEEAAELSVKQDPTARQPRPLLAGKSPGDLIEELEGTEEEPERFMDWRAALQMFAARLRTPVHTYARPNRRLPRLVGLIPGRAYYPGHVGKPSLIVAIDTSGSISTEELVEIGRHLVPISSLVKVTIVECDTVIHRTYPFKGTLREVAGRGGTDLRPVFERAFLGKHRPDGVVYFTDGFGPYPEKDPRIQTLWVLTKPHEFQCPWGQRALLGRSSNRLPLQTCGRAGRHFCSWKTPSSDG